MAKPTRSGTPAAFKRAGSSSQLPLTEEATSWRSSRSACLTYRVDKPLRNSSPSSSCTNTPQYQGPITLDVLPQELGDLPDSDQYVSIEVIQPGERSGQRVLLSVERFNQLVADGDMNAILMNAVAAQQPHRAASPRRRGRGRGTGDGQSRGRGKVEWGLPHRGRISPEEATWVREHLDEVQRLRSERGVSLLDPADPKTKERYGL